MCVWNITQHRHNIDSTTRRTTTTTDNEEVYICCIHILKLFGWKTHFVTPRGVTLMCTAESQPMWYHLWVLERITLLVTAYFKYSSCRVCHIWRGCESCAMHTTSSYIVRWGYLKKIVCGFVIYIIFSSLCVNVVIYGRVLV